MEEAFVQLTENGFQVRPAKLEDLPEAVPVFNAAEVELRGSGEWTVERYTNEWLEGGIDLETSTRIVIEPAGRIVGCVELWDIGNLPVSPWIWGASILTGRVMGSAAPCWTGRSAPAAGLWSGCLPTPAWRHAVQPRPSMQPPSPCWRGRE